MRRKVSKVTPLFGNKGQVRIRCQVAGLLTVTRDATTTIIRSTPLHLQPESKQHTSVSQSRHCLYIKFFLGVGESLSLILFDKPWKHAVFEDPGSLQGRYELDDWRR